MTKKVERCSDSEFRAKVSHLRTVAPPPKGCRIEARRVPSSEIEGCSGTCSKEGRVFTVKIRNDLSEQETEDTLLHEWSHMLAWRPYHPLSGDHGPDWGVWYAEVYRAFYGIA